MTLGTRAVLRQIEPGDMPDCGGCDRPVKFSARNKARKVIINVYEHGRWNRVEIWHEHCYEEEGQPYGKPTTMKMRHHR